MAWPARAAGLELGQAAPPLVLHTLDGQNIEPGVCWARWSFSLSGPRGATPAGRTAAAVGYAARHAGQGLQVLGFSSTAGKPGRGQASCRRLEFPRRIIGSAWAGDYGRMWRIPVSFTIDRSGRLSDNGWDDKQPVWTAERLERIVTPLLG